MNLKTFKPKSKKDELLLLITKNTDRLVGTTQTKPRKT